MDVEFQISPRMLCACGKTVRAMTETERLAYDDALRRLADGRAEESALAGRPHAMVICGPSTRPTAASAAAAATVYLAALAEYMVHDLGC